MSKTIVQQFNETAQRFHRRPALKFKYGNAYISVSFKELQKRVNMMAKGLQELGVMSGDKVAIMSENRTEWVRTDLATLTLGAVTVPVHTTLSPKIIEHVLNDSQARVILISNQEQLNKLVLSINNLRDLRIIIYIDLDHPESFDFDKKLISLDEVMKLGKKTKQDLPSGPKSSDVASIIYTSGTTALPKGVMLTHENFIFDAQASLATVEVTHKDSLLSFLPLSHVLERTIGYYAPLVCRGCCIAYAENIKTLKVNLKEIKPTILVSVPRIFERLYAGIWEKVRAEKKWKYNFFVWALKQKRGSFFHKIGDVLVFKKIRANFGGHFRFTISGGATLNHKLAKFYDRIGIKIVEGYGLTETSPVITVNRLKNIKLGTVGQALDGVEIKIADDKEILVRGQNLMKGYYKNEELTKEAIDSEGWFHTGDLGFMSKDGFLVIIGRKKEMISLSNGKIAWPEQIEIILNNDKLISQSFVYGNNRQSLVALIIPDWAEVSRNLDDLKISSKEPDQLINEPKLAQAFQVRIEKINENLADWEKIRRFTLVAKEFSPQKDEVTPTLKLRRQVIEKNYQTQLEKMY